MAFFLLKIEMKSNLELEDESGDASTGRRGKKFKWGEEHEQDVQHGKMR